ncbi:hypothetical protein [Angustibacter aerolatus]|uniref:Uncharacterized protein n=1 Tax=Angustibacter aerolatus TaxID=1162965 RepID=A0ABQ6JHG4_9ACTN|nr:hypothetical protein [Angustibacter aerolatus]GMA86327.1 hypothetical protein GCM10025868_15770 [Angustibacter aerolatus]
MLPQQTGIVLYDPAFRADRVRDDIRAARRRPLLHGLAGLTRRLRHADDVAPTPSRTVVPRPRPRSA